jgi:DNA repair photolyase
MTKRNRTKYRRRAYEAGMRGKASVSPIMPSRPARSIERPPRDLDDKRAA